MSVGGTGIDPQGGYWEIDHGWDVVGSDGDKVGDVADVQPNYITVSKGFIFKTDMYIPVAAISNVEQDRVYLNVTKDQVETQGWDRMPDTNESDWDRGVERGADFDHMVDTGYEMQPGDTMQTERTGATRTDTTMSERDRIDVPVVEEQLNVGKRDVERGNVRLRKKVTEQEQTVNVPLREEEVRVERRPVDAQSGNLPDDAFQEMDIEIPIRGEEAEVSKQAVVREEVNVRKDVRERQQPVSDTVRREEVVVEGADGAVLDKDRSTGMSDERSTKERKRN